MHWSLAAFIARTGFGLGSSLLLARLLQPVDFGKFALLMSFLTGLSLLRDFGSAASLYKSADYGHDVLDLAYSANLLVAVIICGLGAIAMLVAHQLFALSLNNALWGALAAAVLATSLAAVAGVHLQRAKAYRFLFFVECVGGVVGLAAAATAALQGWGMWALLLNSLSAPVTVVFGGLLYTRQWPRWRNPVIFIRRSIGFSAGLSLSNILNFVSRNADNVIIASLIGAGPLGIYSMAYRFLLYPTQAVSAVVGRVLLPELAEQLRKGGDVRELYLAVCRAVFVPAALGSVLLVCGGDILVLVLLGEKWVEAGRLLMIFGLVLCLQPVVSLEGSIYLATGRTKRMFFSGLVACLVYVAAFLIAARTGRSILAVAKAYVAADLLLGFFALSLSAPCIGLSMGQIVRQARGCILPVLCGAAAAALFRGLVPWEGALVAQLVCVGGLVVAIFFAVSWWTNRAALLELGTMARQGYL